MGTNLHNLPDGIHEVKSWFFQMVTQIIKCSQCRNLSIIFVTHSLPTFCYSAERTTMFGARNGGLKHGDQFAQSTRWYT